MCIRDSAKIVKSFRNYHLFGFTGTPIFAANAGSGGNPLLLSLIHISEPTRPY